MEDEEEYAGEYEGKLFFYIFYVEKAECGFATFFYV
jgi:hypothetical protein